MNLKLLTTTLTAGAIALGNLLFATQPSYAQASTFVCRQDNKGIPTTYAQTPRGVVPIIKWVSDYFGTEFTPEKRCQIVSQRFTDYNNRGILNYLTSGYLNRQPVICAGTSCNSNNLLFTLRSDQNPGKVLEELRNNRSNAAGPSFQGSNPSNSFVTIDFYQYLREAPVESFDSVPDPSPIIPPSNPSNNVW
ncbi:MAG: COP23 domain-containing protein [Oscillatoria sp. PMC 1051.18]|nr:COP23 domain-containing protein [Oscillatoria sp. PMC 1050.18]MEC5029237.1 COP23 domain-containing protein [Oscillatoria sp. PMC 1051.18]